MPKHKGKSISQTAVILTGMNSYTRWHRFLQAEAKLQGVWKWLDGSAQLPLKPQFCETDEERIAKAAAMAESIRTATLEGKPIPQTVEYFSDFKAFKHKYDLYQTTLQQDRIARRFIFDSVDITFLPFLLDRSSAFEQAEVLQRMCKPPAQYLCNQLYVIDFSKSEDIVHYVDEWMDFKADIEHNFPEAFFDPSVKERILNGLPSDFEGWKKYFAFQIDTMGSEELATFIKDFAEANENCSDGE